MIVGEAPGQTEIETMMPFAGPAGLMLNSMLREAGFNRQECYVTNVCKVRPPGNEIKAFFGTKTSGLPKCMGRYPRQPVVDGLRSLERDIHDINPDLILAFGDTALWACTGERGITKWRGSVLECRALPEVGQGLRSDGERGGQARPKVIPTYHPAAILRNYPWRYTACADLRRARRELDREGRKIAVPEYQFSIRPSFEVVQSTLSTLQQRVESGPVWLAADIETQRRHIDCIGLAWSKLDALCIPIIQMDNLPRFYWSVEEQALIVIKLRELLTHPNCWVIGQNFPYDQQYIGKEWGFIPNLKWDTMTIHHSIFSTLPKKLDYQSSLYCDFHRYWKEDAKDEEGHRLADEAQWIYNCRDNVVTWEIREKQELLLKQMNFPSVDGFTPQERQMSFHLPVLKAMFRGVKVSTTKRTEVLTEVTTVLTNREKLIQDIVGHPLNPRSPKQLQSFFYKDMGIRPVISRKTRNPTCDEEALKTISKRSAILAPLCTFINDIRSLGTYRAVCSVPLADDNRIRCSYGIPGTETYRFNSKSDAFGYGTNLQNLTSGTEDLDPDALEAAIASGVLLKPNLRKLLVPDPNYTLVEFDLPQADAQVVAWDSGDEKLKAIFKDSTRDLHTENARDIFGACTGKSDPRRQHAKVGVHAVNYKASARVIAAALGIPLAAAELFILNWFKNHPQIVHWHDRLYTQMTNQKFVENKFGYRRYCFDRVEEDHKHAIAWVPQSTVAIITNTGIKRVDDTLSTSGVDFLLQVHDSAVFQVWTKDGPALVSKIRDCMTVKVPYDDPLEMVPDFKASENSWGECKKRPDWLITKAA